MLCLPLFVFFFPEGAGLRNRLVPLLDDSSKKGCAANESEMMGYQVPGFIYMQMRMYSELHINCPRKKKTCQTCFVHREAFICRVFCAKSVFTH